MRLIMYFTFAFSSRQNREEYISEVVMKKKKIKKLIKKYESESWKCRYNENVLQKRDRLSVFGYEDLGFWKGRTLECESIIEDLEGLLK